MIEWSRFTRSRRI